VSTIFGSSDIWLFPNLQPNLKRKISQDIEEVEISVTVTLRLIPEQEFRNIYSSVNVRVLSVELQK
jgi:hypothetical protein